MRITTELQYPFNINKKWSYIYAYNLNSIIEIFVLVLKYKKITKTEIYSLMEQGYIKPPTNKTNWENPENKKKDRNKLEYLHACEYLNFILRKDELYIPNPDIGTNLLESILYVGEHKNKQYCENIGLLIFKYIVLNYPVAANFVYWFYTNYDEDFSLTEMNNIGKLKNMLIFKNTLNSKGFDTVFIDGQEYKIDKDYQRMVPLFKNWFTSCNVMETFTIPFRQGNTPILLDLPINEKCDKDPTIYYLFYFVQHKINDEMLEIAKTALINLSRNGQQNKFYITEVIYFLAKLTHCSIDDIKKIICKLADNFPEIFYLERLSSYFFPTKYKSHFESSYIQYRGFFRNRMIIKK